MKLSILFWSWMTKLVIVFCRFILERWPYFCAKIPWNYRVESNYILYGVMVDCFFFQTPSESTSCPASYDLFKDTNMCVCILKLECFTANQHSLYYKLLRRLYNKNRTTYRPSGKYGMFHYVPRPLYHPIGCVTRWGHFNGSKNKKVRFILLYISVSNCTNMSYRPIQ